MTQATTVNKSRRQALKATGMAAAGGVALSATGVAGAAVNKLLSAPQAKTGSGAGSALPTCDLTIFQHHSEAAETVTLINTTARPVTIDRVAPIGLKHPDDKIRVRVVGIELPGGKTTLQPGGRLSFDVVATSDSWQVVRDDQTTPIPNVLAGTIEVSSHHQAFNGRVPVTVFDQISV